MQQQQQKTYTLLPWLMWVMAALFYCYEFFLQVSPSVMVNDLMNAFSVNAVAIGVLASLYFYAYAAMQIPAGVMLDHFGTRRLLTAAVATCALGTLLFGLTPFFFITALGRLLIGLGSAFAAIGCMHTAATWLPKNRFSMLTGLMVTIGMVGAINGQAPLALVVKHLNWRHTMFVLSAIGLGVAILMWVIIRDRRPIHSHAELESAERKLLAGLKHVIKNPQTWLCSTHAGLMFAPTLVFGSLWGVPFIQTKLGINTTAAATIVSILYFGWIIGAPVTGWFSDHFKRRKLFMNIGSVGALLALILVIYGPALPGLAIGTLLFFFGLFSSSLILGFSIVREINPPEDTGAAIGFMNCINMLGGAFIPPLIGVILDLTSHNKIMLAHHHYPITSFKFSLVVLPLCMLIASLTLFFIKETNACDNTSNN
ncbi:MAG: MFS transporter [Gammaproteobacteria bacterium]|nr:MFS transporter [Gammaproteobacteria bacterium]